MKPTCLAGLKKIKKTFILPFHCILMFFVQDFRLMRLIRGPALSLVLLVASSCMYEIAVHSLSRCISRGHSNAPTTMMSFCFGIFHSSFSFCCLSPVVWRQHSTLNQFCLWAKLFKGCFFLCPWGRWGGEPGLRNQGIFSGES
jgi:hypothetical protein